MIASQYRITLPADYDMDIIRKRVRDNGYKTDGFEGLKFKLYLTTENGKYNNLQNSYSPLYLWKDHVTTLHYAGQENSTARRAVTSMHP